MRLNISPEPAVLGFLLDRPVHGYDLYKQVNRHLGVVWRVSLSQLYAIVKIFETRGWIETQVRAQTTRPSQKVLALTPLGRQALSDWLDQPAHGLREFRVDFFLRLYFARKAGSRSAEKLVDEQIAACGRELKNVQARSTAAASQEDDLEQITRSFRIQQLAGIARWLKTHRTELCKPSSLTAPIGKKRISRRAGSRQPHSNNPLEQKHWT
jgi:DNA-binding PadR family transcriptional regulator